MKVTPRHEYKPPTRHTPQEEKITQKRGKIIMKLSAILFAKSELATEIENKIEYLSNDLKSNKSNSMVYIIKAQ